jgi:hypothetical protein
MDINTVTFEDLQGENTPEVTKNLQRMTGASWEECCKKVRELLELPEDFFINNE